MHVLPAHVSVLQAFAWVNLGVAHFGSSLQLRHLSSGTFQIFVLLCAWSSFAVAADVVPSQVSVPTVFRGGELSL
jgi:hypothetical protein